MKSTTAPVPPHPAPPSTPTISPEIQRQIDAANNQPAIQVPTGPNGGDQPYQPQQADAGPANPGSLPAATGQLADACAAGGQARADGTRSAQAWGNGGCQLFPNQMAASFDGELRLAERLGVAPSAPGTAGFDSAVSSGTVKWAVLQDGRLVVQPKFVNGQEIAHSVLSRGAPVRAAGEADIAGSSGDGYFGLDINNHSGHFRPSDGSLQIGRDAFAAWGIHF